jgi:hypothetical protein
LWKY